MDYYITIIYYVVLYFWASLLAQIGKESACNVEDLDLILG